MVKYECPNCFNIYEHKGNYEKHMNKKKLCNPSSSITNPIPVISNPPTSIIKENINDSQCCCCFKIFSNKNNRIKHEKTSKCYLILEKKELEKIKQLEEIKADEELDKQYSCPNCLKIFSNKQNRDIHEQKINCTNQNIIYKKCKISHGMKRQVWAKHIGEDIGKIKCLCCKLTEITQLTFVCGHIISEFKGGDISIDNLLPICYSCNASMGTKNLNEYMIDHSL
jgi:hypothetical protein